MRHVLPAGIAGVAIATAMIAVLCGSAFAYFTTTGAGSATAGLPKLSAPTISSAVPAIGGTVALTWTAVTPPGSGTVTYAVIRDGDEPAGNCPTVSSRGTVTTCTDKELEVGTHTYTVTAKWHSWNSTGGSTQAKVTVGAATHFTIGAASTTPGAGVGDNLTITALDEKDSTVTTYTGSHSLTFSGASSSPGGNAPTVANSSGTVVAFGSATAISFTLGVASVISSTKNGLMKIYKAGAANVSVSDGSIESKDDLAVTVASGAASKITLSAASTTPTAGAADNLTTTAYDAYGNVATAYTGSKSLTFSTASASPSGEIPTITDSSGAAIAIGSPTAIVFIAGVASVSGSNNGLMRLYKGGATSLKVSDGTFTSAVVTVTVATVAVELSLSAASAAPTAGAADNLTITALDAYDNIVTTYTGAHNIAFAGATTSPSGAAPTVANSSGTAVPFGTATAINFTAGVATVVSTTKNGVMKLNKVETAGVTATDGSISTSSELEFTVLVGAAAKLSLTDVTVSAGKIAAGCFFTCAITGLGNSGTVKANVAVTDSVGNPISELGTGHAVKITATSGSTVVGTPLALPGTGLAETAGQFTYTSKSKGTFSDTITVATSEGTAYTSATATTSR
jgi:hypothetical protein